MKKLITLFLFGGIISSAFAQSPLELVKERVGNPLILKNWKVGEAKEVDHAVIIRTGGENAIEHRTNVLYTPFGAIMKQIDERAKAENEPAEKNEVLKQSYSRIAQGGQIALFYDRDDINLADPALFTVVLKNSRNEIIYSQRLENTCPYYYRWGIWYYYAVINVPVNVGQKFDVEVIDAGLGNKYDFAVSVKIEGMENEQLLSNR